MKKYVFYLLLLFSTTAFAQERMRVESNNGTVALEWYADDIVRVVKTTDGKEYSKKSLSVTATPVAVKAKVNNGSDEYAATTSRLKVTVSKDDGVVRFYDAKGRLIVSENGSASFTPAKDGDRKTYSPKQGFGLESDEAVYGLGILQNGKMSQRGVRKVLCPGNTEDGVPFIQSVKGYGIYWDNYSATEFADKDNVMSFKSEVGDAVDYYFMYGGSADGVVAKIRQLTGDAPMIPLWAYGFFQSKERYKSQREIVDVLHRYRSAGIPIDCMVQDWQYWGNNYLWNAMEFMNEEFSNPQAMIDDIHKNNARCIISIWSSFGPMTKPYRQLDEKGLLFNIETWPQSGISHIWPPRKDYPSGVRVYDCYNPEARDIYWNNLKRLYDLKLDGWWMDSTEPDNFYATESDWNRKTALGTFRSVRLAYPLMTVGGVYDHQRATSDSTRVFILTRSGSFGQQRYASNVWSGDVVSTWEMLRSQVPAGLNYSLTGNPYFNSDLGGFFAGSYNRAWKNKPAYENPAYHELYVRWTQMGVFTPMMRSHGADVPREFYYYGKAGEPVYDALVNAVKQRYRLLPYIYSTAWLVSKHQGTFLRALMMDFADDKKVWDIADEFMFGDALLATPVLKANYTPEVVRKDKDANAGWDKNTGKTSIENLDNVDFTKKYAHTVYLPAGTKWYYFHTGKQYDGGSEVSLDLSLADNPFFVRAGAIVPIGPDVQWTTEKAWDDLELKVYPGANGKFTLYEDEGDSYNYEKGQYTEIPITWNDKSRTLTIGRRKGSYPGMIAKRSFRVVLPDGAVKKVAYSGKAVNVKF
ncbi:DUF5110 domain-containing protein [Prevotella sp. PINT]|jgi:Alpha-glucosidases, family 31 of glycosyl hydrolases|uniref:glycoside hydrolase family 31 protein n=1 Tax=Palleniella intestinalis TaxID=2736291 RepID=UPI001557F266|nr:TIM-barrel domain-containing protein [Palleniella intestinalis]NPD81608.1 DUF5110 domain-containing protein [Palleniella intestinalis]